MVELEGIETLDDWFQWATEWATLLRIYGGLTSRTAALEIGCGLGRIAYALRFLVWNGTYDGFEIFKPKVDFLNAKFSPLFPNFHFKWADVYNKRYNTEGKQAAPEYRFPYEDNSFDVIYAASVFTHLLPDATARYFKESARVLRPGGKCVFSFFILDNYDPKRGRPGSFSDPMFNVDHPCDDFGDDFRVGVPDNPEAISAYTLQSVERYAADAGLKLAREPLPGLWSGAFENWISTQDLLIFEHA